MRLMTVERVKSSMSKTEYKKEFIVRFSCKSNVGSLINELTMKMVDWSQLICDHVTHMSNLAVKLKTLEMEVHEKCLVQFIMNSIPLEISQFQVNYNTSKDNETLEN